MKNLKLLTIFVCMPLLMASCFGIGEEDDDDDNTPEVDFKGTQWMMLEDDNTDTVFLDFAADYQFISIYNFEEDSPNPCYEADMDLAYSIEGNKMYISDGSNTMEILWELLSDTQLRVVNMSSSSQEVEIFNKLTFNPDDLTICL